MSAANLQWQLDSRLHNDTKRVCETDDVSILLMNDSRWPWLILVPKYPGAEEWSDLEPELGARAFQQVQQVADILKVFTGCEKINIAAIGNIVRQLHIHVIARSEGDANWPGPVWGFGNAEPYDCEQAERLIEHLREKITHASIS